MPNISAKAPLTSMTGYAVFESLISGVAYRVHLKSVNHRYFEMKWRAPRAWLRFETEARSTFQEILGRGSIECWIETTAKGSPKELEHQSVRNLFRRLGSALEASKSETMKMPQFVRALILTRFPDLWWEAQEEAEISSENAKENFRRAAEELLRARWAEGAKLGLVLKESAQKMQACLRTVQTKIPEIQLTQRTTFRERLDALGSELKLPQAVEQRVLQEFLFLAEKRDVAEEVERIEIHLGALSDFLEKPSPQAGKRIEFIAQELHREWTTLGNKIQDPKITQTIIDAKLEIDRIKEQAANLN